MDKNKVLSFSGDRDSLVRREFALRNGGFTVVSLVSESQARFEIEMGSCGFLLICFRTRADTIRELTNLFRRNCPEGRIIFVMDETHERPPLAADYIVSESAGPEAIVRALRSGSHPTRKAS